MLTASALKLSGWGESGEVLVNALVNQSVRERVWTPGNPKAPKY